jgi:hypothetical protein
VHNRLIAVTVDNRSSRHLTENVVKHFSFHFIRSGACNSLRTTVEQLEFNELYLQVIIAGAQAVDLQHDFSCPLHRQRSFDAA